MILLILLFSKPDTSGAGQESVFLNLPHRMLRFREDKKLGKIGLPGCDDVQEFYWSLLL